MAKKPVDTSKADLRIILFLPLEREAAPGLGARLNPKSAQREALPPSNIHNGGLLQQFGNTNVSNEVETTQA